MLLPSFTRFILMSTKHSSMEGLFFRYIDKNLSIACARTYEHVRRRIMRQFINRMPVQWKFKLLFTVWASGYTE